MLIFNKINEYLSKKKRQTGENGNPNNFESLLKTKVLEIYTRKNKNLNLEDLNYEMLFRDLELMKEAIKEINDVYYGKEKEKLMITIKKIRKELIAFEKRHL